MTPPNLSDNADAPDAQEVLRQLNYAKCAFQLRTIEMVLGAGSGQASAAPQFDYIKWLSGINGIPAGWGSSAADRAGVATSFHGEPYAE